MDDHERVISGRHRCSRNKGTPFRSASVRAASPGMDDELRVTTDPVYYEEHSESIEFRPPGNPLCNGPKLASTTTDLSLREALEALLDEAS